MSTSDANAAPVSEPDAVPLYSVNRTQDGAEVRRGLTIDEAQSECAILNGQARAQVGLTPAVYDERGSLVRGAQPVYGSMFHGEITRYEVRSVDGLMVST